MLVFDVLMVFLIFKLCFLLVFCTRISIRSLLDRVIVFLIFIYLHLVLPRKKKKTKHVSCFMSYLSESRSLIE